MQIHLLALATRSAFHYICFGLLHAQSQALPTNVIGAWLQSISLSQQPPHSILHFYLT